MKPMQRLLLLGVLAALALGLTAGPAPVRSPVLPSVSADSAGSPSAAPFGPPSGQPETSPIRFAVIGDMGNGSRRQFETARRLWTEHARFPYTFVLTVGDNIYGDEDPRDMERKFIIPYKPIIDARIPFFASLGNHDDRTQVVYPLFNMKGQPYYTFTRGPAQFFALDSTLMTQAQLRWLEDELTRSEADWKIVYFHHPIYSSGLRHGPTLVLRTALEPILATFGVRVVFTGHEHFYERLQPRYGVQPFITGSGGQLRRNGIRRGSIEMAAGYDQDNVFLLAEIAGDSLHFEAVSRLGAIVDSGTIGR